MLRSVFNILSLHIDPRIFELQKDIEFYQYFVGGLFFVIFLLFVIVILQRVSIRSYKKGKKPASRKKGRMVLK